MMYAGCVKGAPGKQEPGWVKFKISPGTGEAKFSLGEGKKSNESGFTGSGFTGSVTKRCLIVGSYLWKLTYGRQCIHRSVRKH